MRKSPGRRPSPSLESKGQASPAMTRRTPSVISSRGMPPLYCRGRTVSAYAPLPPPAASCSPRDGSVRLPTSGAKPMRDESRSSASISEGVCDASSRVDTFEGRERTNRPSTSATATSRTMVPRSGAYFQSGARISIWNPWCANSLKHARSLAPEQLQSVVKIHACKELLRLGSTPANAAAQTGSGSGRLPVEKCDYRPKDEDQNTVEDDLLRHDRARHWLYDVVDEVGRHDGEQCDGHAESNALSEPWFRFHAPRVDPDKSPREHDVGKDHQRKELLRVRFRPEQSRQLGIVIVKQLSVNDETAGKPRDEDHNPGDEELLAHGFPFGGEGMFTAWM